MKPMENSVENMENPAKSRGIFFDFFLGYGKPSEILCQEVLKNSRIFSHLHKCGAYNKFRSTPNSKTTPKTTQWIHPGPNQKGDSLPRR